LINAAAATAEGETATPSAQERMNRQFNLAETTPAPDVTPAGKTVAGTRVAAAHGTVGVDPRTVAAIPGPAVDATVAVQGPLPPRKPAIARGWLVASGTAALVLVALGIVALKSDPPPPVNRGAVTAATPTATAPPTTSSTPPSTTTEEPLLTPIETTTTAVPPTIPITPTTTAVVPPEDDSLRRGAAQARTRTAAARAAALAVEAEPQPAFRRASAALRDAESLVARGRFDSAITKYSEASRLFASAEVAARAAKERRVDPPPTTTREARPTPPIDVTTTRATVPEARPADDDPRPTDPRPDPPSASASAEDAIRDTIAEYVSAQEDLDADRYVRTYPSADRDRIAAAFRSFRSQDLDLTISSVQVNGSRATVRAQESRVAVPRAGTVQRVNAERSFTLERRGSRWVIVSIR
jgi:hypothetical protein